jgi:hypothetical protein
VADWDKILVSPTAIKAAPSRRQLESKDRVYKLELHTATDEAAYIIACTFAAYSCLREQAHEVTDQLFAAFDVQSAKACADTTDSSNDSEAGWQTAGQRRHGDRGHNGKSAARRERALQNQLAKLSKHSGLSQAAVEDHTKRPLLALATTVTLHSVHIPYISCIIDNFQSAGCNVHDLAHDPIFQRITQCTPPHPVSHWSVQQRTGDAQASLWIREDCKQVIAELSTRVRDLLQLWTKVRVAIIFHSR